jgi:hypothetical protein
MLMTFCVQRVISSHNSYTHETTDLPTETLKLQVCLIIIVLATATRDPMNGLAIDFHVNFFRA